MKTIGKINLLLITLFIFLMGCTAAKQSDNSSSELDNGSNGNLTGNIIIQAAKADCTLTNLTTNDSRKIAFSGDSAFNANPTVGDQLSIDCSSSVTNGRSTSYLIDLNNSGNFQPINGPVLLNYAQSVTMVIRAQDDADSTVFSDKAFATQVECIDVALPNAVAITATPNSVGGPENYASYNLDVNLGTGVGVSFDFNGDGIYDPFNLITNPYEVMAFELPIQDVFHMYVSQRLVNVKLTNSCGEEKEYTNIAVTTPFAREEGAYNPAANFGFGASFIQADILDGDDNGLAANTPDEMIVTEIVDPRAGRMSPRFDCAFNSPPAGGGASFSIHGLNWYRGEERDAGAFDHGVTLSLNGFTDADIDAVGITQTFSNFDTKTDPAAGAINVSSADFRNTTSDEGARSILSGASGCKAELSFQKVRAVGTCTPTSGTIEAGDYDYQYTIWGQYLCNGLSDGREGFADIQDAKFSCIVSLRASCGGGGGGGGAPTYND